MITTIPKSVKLWGRGQLTIPKDARQALKLDENTPLSAFVVGPCLVLTPKRLLGRALAKDIQKAMKAQGLTLEDVLRELKTQRKRYHQEVYGL